MTAHQKPERHFSKTFVLSKQLKNGGVQWKEKLYLHKSNK